MSRIGIRNMMRFRNTGFGPRISTLSRRAAATRIQRVMRKRLFTMRRNKKNVRSGQGITTQRDARKIYTKRYMPKSKKYRWRSFVKKIHAVSEKELGARQVVFNKLLQPFNVTPDNHLEQGVVLYGQASDKSHYNDLSNIAQYENIADNDSKLKGQTTYDSTKFMFQSAVLDVTIRNTSRRYTQQGENLVLTNAGEAKMEVDVYEMTISKDARDSLTTLTDVGSLWVRNKDYTEKLANGSAELDHQQRGVTPFEFSYALGRYGVKVLKKTKYLLPNGECFTYQIRDPKRKTITQHDMQNTPGFNRPGFTRVLWIVAKLVPGLTVGQIDGGYREELSLGVTRKYLYKLEGSNEDRTTYQANT